MQLIILSVIIQVALAVHVVKTGRDSKWLYFILVAPFVGSAVYIIVELLPELLRSKTAHKVNEKITEAVDPERDLRKTSAELQSSANIQNIMAFAEECVKNQHYEEAIETYQSALKGQYENDPQLLLGLAQAQFAGGQYREAVNTLDNLITSNPDFKSSVGHMLYARALEACGEFDKALHEYEVLSSYYPGPEAKCRYALLLKNTGKETLARSLLQEVITTAERSPKHYKKMHKDWIDLALRECFKGSSNRRQ